MSVQSLLVVGCCCWVAVGVLWTPLLASSRIRTLFGRWPTTNLAANYVVAAFLVGVVHVCAIGVGLVGARFAGGGAVAAVLVSNIAVPTLGWVGVVRVLPRVRDADYARRAALPLGVGALWYAAVSTGAIVAFLVLALALYLPFE